VFRRTPCTSKVLDVVLISITLMSTSVLAYDRIVILSKVFRLLA